MKKLLGVAIIVVLVAVNPLFRMAVKSYSYSEADMRRAVEGQWTLTPKGGAPIHFTATERGMHAAREGLVRAAGACGERSWVHTASACADFSRLDLEIASTDVAVDRATFEVYGLDFVEGRLELDANDHFALEAHLASDGKVLGVTYRAAGREVPATLERM